MSIRWLNTWETGTNGLYAMKKKENVEKMKPLLTFWPPGPPLLAKLTVTWSADINGVRTNFGNSSTK